MDKGILYIASKKVIEEAERSAINARDKMDGISISVITDAEGFDKSHFYDVTIKNGMYNDWRAKPNNIVETPYDHTIYLDSDTFVTGDIRPVFELLSEFDISIAQEPMGKTRDIDDIPDSFPEFNSGVMVFRNNPKVMELFEKWNSIYQDRKERMDQPALREALFKTNIEMTVLPPEYNCRWSVAGIVSDEVKIYHGRLIDLDFPLKGIETETDISTAIKKIGDQDGIRVFISKSGNLECIVRR